MIRKAAAHEPRRGSEIDNLAIHDVHLTLCARCKLRIVGHHDDSRSITMELFDQLHNAARHVRIEISGRLVRKQHAGATR